MLERLNISIRKLAAEPGPHPRWNDPGLPLHNLARPAPGKDGVAAVVVTSATIPWEGGTSRAISCVTVSACDHLDPGVKLEVMTARDCVDQGGVRLLQ